MSNLHLFRNNLSLCKENCVILFQTLFLITVAVINLWGGAHKKCQKISKIRFFSKALKLFTHGMGCFGTGLWMLTRYTLFTD
eukprot:UN21025